VRRVSDGEATVPLGEKALETQLSEGEESENTENSVRKAGESRSPERKGCAIDLRRGFIKYWSVVRDSEVCSVVCFLLQEHFVSGWRESLN